jgi:PAS domain S-box-containing protein
MNQITLTHFSTILPLIIIGLLTGAMALFTWYKWKNAQWSVEITLVLISLFFWTLGYAAELAVAPLQTKLLLAQVQYIGITAVPFFWLMFALKFAGYGRWITKKHVGLLATLPVTTFLLAVTNEGHNLLWKSVALDNTGPLVILQISRGPWFWVFNLFAQICIIIGSVILMMHLSKRHNQHHWRVRLMAFLPIIPIVGNLAYLFDLTPEPGLDLTSYTFAMSTCLLAWGLYRLELIGGSNPIARQTAVDSINDGVIVLDKQQRIIDINPAASHIIGKEADAIIGKNIIAVIRSKPELVACYKQISEANSGSVFDLTFNERSYAISLSKVTDDFEAHHGWIVALRDISERKEVKRELAQQKAIFEGIAKIAQALAEGLEPKIRFQNAVNATADLAKAEKSSLFLFNKQKEIIHIYFSHDVTPDATLKNYLKETMGRGFLGWMLQEQKLVIIPDAGKDPRWIPVPHNSRPTLSVLAIPIIHKQYLIGILTLEHSQANFFQPEIAEILHAATNQLALALENVQIYEQEIQHVAQQKTVYQVLRQLNLHLDSQTVIQNTLNIIQKQIAWTAVHIAVPKDEEAGFVIEATTCKNVEISETVLQSAEVQAIIHEAFQSGETQTVPHLKGLSRDKKQLPYNSMIAVPMIYQKKKIGVFVAQDVKTAVFTKEEAWLAESLAEACALALSNAQLHNQTKMQLREQTAIRQAVAAITSTLDLPTLLQQLAQQMGEAINATSVLIHTYEPDTKRSNILARFHSEDATHDERLRCEQWRQQINTNHLTEKLKGTLIFNVAAKGKNGAPHDSEINPIVTLPLHVGHKTIAFAELWNSRDKREFTQKEIGLARTIAQHAAIAIENANLFQTINKEQGRLTALIQASRDGIILVGTNRRILIANEMALQMLHQPDTPSSWIDQPLSHILKPLQEKHAQEIRLMKMIPNAKDVKSGEFDLEEKIISWQNMLVSAEDHPIGHLLLLRDVTDERVLERMRDDLTRTMVHDLRNPIGAMQMSLDVLLLTGQAEMSAQSKALVERAKNITDRTLNLVNQILDISQLENGKMPIQYEKFELQNLVEEVLNVQTTIATEKDITIVNRLPTKLPPVWADPKLMERVFQNLVGNALKFTPVGGKVTIAVTNGRFHSREPLQVTISDTGSGIPANIRPRLFQKFATGDQSERGNGLGLAFCKMVQDNHGEKIEILDSSPLGTTFLLTVSTAVPLQTFSSANLVAANS